MASRSRFLGWIAIPVVGLAVVILLLIESQTEVPLRSDSQGDQRSAPRTRPAVDGPAGGLAANPVAAHIDGFVKMAGEPVGEAPIAVHIGRSTTRSVTGTDGSFSFTLHERGQISLEVTGFEVISAPVALEGDLRDVVVEVRRECSVAGTVFFRGDPIRGAEVTLDPTHTTASDGNGHFRFANVASGRHILLAKSEANAARNRGLEIWLAPSQEITEVKLDLDRSAWIGGMVVDEAGQPVPNVSVRWDCTSTPTDWRQASTDGAGGYRVLYLGGGCDYTATVRSAAGISGFVYGPHEKFATVFLPDGSSRVDDVRLVVASAHASISGRVINERGLPVPNETVVVPNGQSVEGHLGIASTGVTSEDGVFTIEGLSPGLYSIGVGANAEHAIVHGIETGRRDLVIIVPATTTVHGKIEGFESGIVEVGLVDELSDIQGVVLHAVRGDSFTIEAVKRGDHLLLATNGRLVAVETISVTPPDDPAPLMRARPTVKVTGTVTGSGSTSSAQCTWSLPILKISEWTIGHFDVRPGETFAFDAPIGMPVRVHCTSERGSGSLDLGVVGPGSGVSDQNISLGR